MVKVRLYYVSGHWLYRIFKVLAKALSLSSLCDVKMSLATGLSVHPPPQWGTERSLGEGWSITSGGKNNAHWWIGFKYFGLPAGGGWTPARYISRIALKPRGYLRVKQRQAYCLLDRISNVMTSCKLVFVLSDITEYVIEQMSDLPRECVRKDGYWCRFVDLATYLAHFSWQGSWLCHIV